MGVTLASREELRSELVRTQREMAYRLMGRREASFERGPLLWLTQHTRTENPKYKEQGVAFEAPFPKKDYFVPVMQALLDEPRLMLAKSREMITSWEVMGYIAWCCIWEPGTQAIVQADKEPKAFGLVNYARILWRNSEPWIRERCYIVDDAKGRVRLNTGSELIGVPSGEDQVRYYHPTIYMMDEAAKLPEAEACYNAAHPVAKQIIAISTAAPGWFARMCDR